MKIKIGKIFTESPIYVANGKTEILIDDVLENSIDVNAGDTIKIFTKTVTKKEIRNSLLLFPIHIISAIFRCILLNIEKDYVEKKLEPYAIECKYVVSKEDVDNGIKIDYIPSKYRVDSDMIFDAKININSVKQESKQIPNPLQGIKVLNAFYMDMGWLVALICALGIYCVGFGIQHLSNSRGVVSIILGLIISAGILAVFIIKIITDKRMLKKLWKRDGKNQP